MKWRGIASLTQSIAVVLGCAALAYSLSRLPNMETSDGPVLALVGAAIGLIGICVGFAVRPNMVNFERRRSSRKLFGLRIAVVGLFAAAAGWLIAIFISDKVGYFVMALSILVGGCGVVMHRLTDSGE